MDKPRIFLGSSGKQSKLLQALARGLEDIAHVGTRPSWTGRGRSGLSPPIALPGTSRLGRTRSRK